MYNDSLESLGPATFNLIVGFLNHFLKMNKPPTFLTLVFVSLILQLPLDLTSQTASQGTRRLSAAGGVQAASKTCPLLEH